MHNKKRIHLVVLLAYGLVTAVMTYPLAVRLNQLPVDVTDPANHFNRDSFIFLWNWWWLKHSLFELHVSPFFSTYLYYPHGTSLVFLPFTGVYGVLSLPLQWILGSEQGTITAYSMFVLCSFVAAAYGMFLLAREVTSNAMGAFVAGLIFSFCANRIWNLSALNLFCFEFVVFFVFSLLVLLKRPGIRPGMGTGAAAACLFYSSLEYSLFTSLLAGLLIAAYVFNGRRDRNYLRTLGIHGAAAVATFLLLAAPFLYALASFALKSGLSSATMGLDSATAFSNDALSFLIPGFYQRFYDGFISFEYLYAKGIDWRVIGLKSFLGYTAVALAIIGAAKAQGKGRFFWLFVVVMFLILSMGPYLHVGGTVYRNVPLPYLFLYQSVPFLHVARAPERMIVLVMLSLAIMAAFGVKAIAGERRGKGLAIAAAASVLVIIENFAAPLKPARLPIPDLFRTMAREDATYAVLNIPTEEDMRPISMYFQIVHQKPMLGGQVPRRSKGADTLFEEDVFLRAVTNGKLAEYYLDRAALSQIESNLEMTRLRLLEHNVRYIMLHTWHMSPRDEDIARKTLAHLRVRAVKKITYLDGEIVLYQLY
ncbi:MAG: hypothetical protein Kow0099_16800 [Candidatus Abyssubacteria bacterium]